jgi:hypothetical protein
MWNPPLRSQTTSSAHGHITTVYKRCLYKIKQRLYISESGGFFMKKAISILLAIILCMSLCVSLAACGGGASQVPADNSQVDQDEDQSAGQDQDGDAGSGEAVIQYDIDVIRSNLTEAYGGATENGEYMGFGVNDDGSFAIMIFFTPEQHVTFVGSAVVNGDMVSIQDQVNGLEITFQVLSGDDGGAILDLGQYGKGAVGAIPIDDLVDTLVKVLNNTFAVG